MCLAADHTARRRQDSLAQGLPWVSQQDVLCPEGAKGIEMCGRSDLKPILAVPSGPFRAYCGGGKFTQGKPWAKLSCPFGAGPPGRMIRAKHRPHRANSASSVTASFLDLSCRVRDGSLDWKVVDRTAS
jgi:hypothetical protein